MPSGISESSEFAPGGEMNRELREKRLQAEGSWLAGVKRAIGTSPIRPEIFSSWSRSATRVSIETSYAPMMSPTDVSERFGESRFGRACRVIQDDLRELAETGDMVAALTDQDVTISWMVGGRRMTKAAEKVHFVVGGRWSEEAVGTNALALAEKLVQPSMVFSAEHFLPAVHDWVCYSAPVHDSVTGAFQGVVDVSSLWSKTNPALLTTVRSLARCVQYELDRMEPEAQMTVRNPELSCLEIRTMGVHSVRRNGVTLKVSRRQLEILTVLAMYPAGLSLDEVTAHVYGDHMVSPVTVKAELSHLRTLLGGAVGSRPYRLLDVVDADHVAILSALNRSDATTALSLYAGSMLPASESPAIAGCRHQIDVALRTAVIASKNPELLFRLSSTCPDDDHVHECARLALSSDDVRSGLVEGRLWHP